MIRINQIKLDIGTDEKILNSKIQKLLRLKTVVLLIQSLKNPLMPEKRTYNVYLFSGCKGGWHRRDYFSQKT